MLVLSDTLEEVSLLRLLMTDPVEYARYGRIQLVQGRLRGAETILGYTLDHNDFFECIRRCAAERGVGLVLAFGYCRLSSQRAAVGDIVVPEQVHAGSMLRLDTGAVRAVRNAVSRSIEEIPWGTAFRPRCICEDVSSLGPESCEKGFEDSGLYPVVDACHKADVPVAALRIVGAARPDGKPRERIGKAIATASVIRLIESQRCVTQIEGMQECHV
jgi:hypothetical protein